MGKVEVYYETIITDLLDAVTMEGWQYRTEILIKGVEKLILELQLALDMTQGEVAERLDALYDYWRYTLSEAVVLQDKKQVQIILEMAQEMAEAYKTAQLVRR